MANIVWRFLKPRSRPLKPGTYSVVLEDVRIVVANNGAATYEVLLGEPRKVKKAVKEEG